MKQTPDPKTDDYKNLLDLLALYSEATHRLAALEAAMNSEILETIDDHKEDYAVIQKGIAEAETALEVIATRHPEWFAEKKGLKTPYGTVKFTKSTTLVIPNEELSIELIRREAHGLTLDPENLLREKTELAVEVLETLTDDQLKAFRIKRASKQNFSVTPAKVDLGKAVKEAAAKKPEAA